MQKTLPSSTKVVVIGGGVAGTSCAYHLAKNGWKDTILLERDQLTSGTTWHAAGLVGQLGATATITKLRKYSLNLYKELEKKTELSTGLKQNGAITVASSKERLQELLRQATSAQLFDVNVEVLDKQKVKELYPVINDQDILGGVYMPEDGQADPVGVTNVLAKAAKLEGAKIFEKTPVTKILVKEGRITGVETSQGKIDCEYVVLATGMWSRQIGEDIEVSVPLYPNEHFYIITEPMKDLPKDLPVLRDYNDCLYLKEDAGKMLVGIFEPGAKNAFKEKGIVPNDFSFEEFPDATKRILKTLREDFLSRTPTQRRTLMMRRYDRMQELKDLPFDAKNKLARDVTLLQYMRTALDPRYVKAKKLYPDLLRPSKVMPRAKSVDLPGLDAPYKKDFFAEKGRPKVNSLVLRKNLLDAVAEGKKGIHIDYTQVVEEGGGRSDVVTAQYKEMTNALRKVLKELKVKRVNALLHTFETLMTYFNRSASTHTTTAVAASLLRPRRALMRSWCLY